MADAVRRLDQGLATIRRTDPSGRLIDRYRMAPVLGTHTHRAELLVGFLSTQKSDRIWLMAKVKISATVDPAHLERAKELTGVSSVSEVLERGLVALIEDELERIHIEGYARLPQAGETVKAVDAGIWADLPWDEEGE